MKAINIQDKFSKFSKNWHPHQIAVVDDMQVILAKLKGEFVWHAHEHEDEVHDRVFHHGLLGWPFGRECPGFALRF